MLRKIIRLLLADLDRMQLQVICFLNVIEVVLAVSFICTPEQYMTTRKLIMKCIEK